ncbi:MAG: signal peptidase I [Actinomycetota bacterium]
MADAARVQESRDDSTTAPPPPRPPEIEEPRHRPFWRELPVLVVIAFVVALLLKTFVLQAFFIPSGSMEPTLMVGDRVLVEKVSYRFSAPDRGDVVVFEKDLGAVVSGEEDDRSVLERVGDSLRGLFGFPTGSQQDFIKRVMAVGGDTIEGKDGLVFVNGEAVEEPYLAEESSTSSFGPVDVPQGTIFVMGDNRGNSDDSRNFGPVPVDTVVGRGFILIWPPKDFGTL